MEPKLAPVLVTNLHGLQLAADFMKRVRVFGMDTETNITDNFVERKIRTITVGDRNEQYVIDLLAFAGSSEALIASQGNYGAAAGLLLGPVIETLRPFFESAEYTKVGRWCLGLRTQGFYDCFRAEQNIWAGLVPLMFTSTNWWGLENVVERYVGLLMSKDEQKGFSLSEPLTQNQIIYCALDVRLPMAVRNGQLKILRADGLDKAATIDCDAISPFGDLHLNGVATDDERWTALIAENRGRKRQIITRLDEFFVKVVGTKYVSHNDRLRLDELEVAWRDCPQKTAEEKKRRAALRLAYMDVRKVMNGKDKLAKDCEGEAAINYASNKQLLDAFRKMGFGKKKMPDTNDSTLEALSKFPNLTVDKAFEERPDLDLPVIDLLRLFRAVEKQLTTYGSAWITTREEGGHRNKFTNRIHSNINLFGTDTGRTSSSSPNLQNLPKENRFRHCFIARPGYRILTVDYSGCELRILAFLSQDPVWMDAFARDWDLHSIGAEMLFGQEWIDATEPGCKFAEKKDKCKCKGHKKLRDRVKALNFGLAYGLTATGLSIQLGINEEDAQKLINSYKAAFPVVMKYLDRVGDMAKATLQIRSVEGGRRRWNKPDWEVAKQRAIEDEKKRAKKQEREERPVSQDDIRRKYMAMYRSIEREGKNAPIQRTNAYLTKRAMYLIWLGLEKQFGAYFFNTVHDEIVIECPEETAEACNKFVGECMTQAGAEYIKGIVMTTEGSGADKVYWTK
jgi:DNA polymerase-1